MQQLYSLLILACILSATASSYTADMTLPTTSPTSFPAADFVMRSDETFGASYGFGSAVSGVGDLNHDGIDDWAMSNPAATAEGSSELNTGVVVVFWGKIAWANASSWPSLTSFPDTTLGLVIYGSSYSEKVGRSLGGGCDLNNDGFDDMFFSAFPAYTKTAADSVYIVFGQRRWPASITAAQIPGTYGVRITSGSDDLNQWSQFFGARALKCVNDFNGDNIKDLMFSDAWADSSRGRVILVYGQKSTYKWPAVINASALPQQPSRGKLITSNLIGERPRLGYAVESVDLNVDGHVDLVISAIGALSSAGMVNVVWGGRNDTLLAANLSLPVSDLSQGFFFVGKWAGYRLGYALAAGDINGDSHTDLIISNNGYANIRTVWIVFASSSFTTASLSFNMTTLPDSITFKDTTGYYLSISAGDINSDGYDDLFVGAFTANSNAGHLYIVFGSSSPSDLTIDSNSSPDGLTWSRFTGPSIGAQMGQALGVVPSYNHQAVDLIAGCVNTNYGAAYLFSRSPCKTMSNGRCTRCLPGYGLTSQGTCVACDSTTGVHTDGTTDCLPSTALVVGCATYNTVTGKCLRCSGGWGLNITANKCTKCGSEEWSDGVEKCSQCATDYPCTECSYSTGLCTACPAGMGLDWHTCKKCEPGYWSDGTTACRPCRRGMGGSACLACEQKTGKCTQCVGGHGVNAGKCPQCINSYSNGSYACTACSYGPGGHCVGCDTTTGQCYTRCEAGFGFSNISHVCMECSDGFWSNGTSGCMPCNCNSTSKCLATTGQCNPCYAGEGQLASNHTCAACADGQWSLGTGTCSNCSAGGCINCIVTSGVCTQCSSGYGLVDGACSVCPAGQWSDGTASCVNCSDSHCRRCTTTTGVCMQCQSGFGISSEGICVECPDGYFSDGTKQCTRCLGGSDCILCNSATGTCDKCQPGTGYDSTTAQCTLCLPGNYSKGSTPCERCSPTCQKCGSSSGNCTLCYSGYQPIPKNETECEQCQDGMWSNGTLCVPCSYGTGGSACLTCGKTNGVCKKCAAGYGILPDGRCVTCSSNTYFSDGTAPCFPCSIGPGGSHCTTCSSTNGACSQCAAGYGLTANHTCVACKTGSFSDGTTGCKACSTISSKCLACNSQTGQCTKCSAGSGVKAGTCETCPAGTFSDSSNNLGCTSCVLGVGGMPCLMCDSKTGSCTRCSTSFGLKASSSKKTCRPCDSLTYSFGNTSCVSCQEGCESCNSTTGYCYDCAVGFSLSNGVCTACKSGTFGLGNGTCDQCSTGIGGSACSLCVSDTGKCTACTAGYGFYNGSCTLCSKGWYSKGESVCAQCIKGPGGNKCASCESQTGVCLTCDAGYAIYNGVCILAVQIDAGGGGAISTTVIGIIAGGAALGGIIILIVILSMVIVLIWFKRKKTVDITTQMPSIIMAPIRTSGSSSGPAPEYSIGLGSMGDGVNPPIYSMDPTDIMMVPPPLSDLSLGPMSSMTPNLSDLTAAVPPPSDSITISNGSGLQ